MFVLYVYGLDILLMLHNKTDEVCGFSIRFPVVHRPRHCLAFEMPTRMEKWMNKGLMKRHGICCIEFLFRMYQVGTYCANFLGKDYFCILLVL